MPRPERATDHGRRSTLRILGGQLVYQLRLLRRSPIATFATLVVPLMVLLAIGLLYSGTRIGTRGQIRYIQFFTPAMVVFATVTACYMWIISSTVLAREQGILKRIRATPLPSWVYLTGRVLAAGLVALAASVVVVAVGTLVYGFQIVWSSVPPALAVLALAIFCFCSLGLAVTVIVPSAEAALPLAWGSMLPLCFVSDVFQPIDSAPAWLRSVAAVFPPRRVADQLEALFNPVSGHMYLNGADLAVLAAWGVGAALFALLAFRWEPVADEGPVMFAPLALVLHVRDRVRGMLGVVTRHGPAARPRI